MEMLIELTEAELDKVSGGAEMTISFSNTVVGDAGSVTFSVTNTASGTTATVSCMLIINPTASSSSLAGSFLSP